MTDRLPEIKHRRETGIPLWSHETEWMIDEIERLRNLKGVLMELGNRLVTDHGWEPAAGAGARTCGQTRDHTGLIAGLTQQINDNREMRELLNEFGFDWPIVDEDE